MRFEHQTIDGSPPCGRLFVCQPTDLTGDGYPDLIVGGMGAEALPVIGDRSVPVLGRLLRRLERGLFWYENPGAGRHDGTAEWTRHTLSPSSDVHALGSALGDVTGNGRLDLLVGQGYGGSDIYWFERPADPRREWTKRLVADDFSKYHDLAFGDVDNDGDPEVVGLSQESRTVFYYDVPSDPTRSPWPSEHLTVVDRGVDVEGLEIADVDGDGDNELIAGTAIYHHSGAATGTRPSSRRVEVDGGAASDVAAGWTRTDVATGWDWTRVAVGDLDGDGDTEVVFAEGDSPTYGTHMGRVAWFDPPEWEPHVLADDLFCPHTLQVADFDDTGAPDVYVAEMGLGDHDDSARHLRFRNRGGGEFTEEVVETGVPTHEARAVDVDGDGRPDVIGKSFEPNVHVDVWYNRP